MDELVEGGGGEWFLNLSSFFSEVITFYLFSNSDIFV